MKVSNPLSGIEIPPPRFQPKWLSATLMPAPLSADARYQPAPPIAYGETLGEGNLYTRLPVTLVKLRFPPPPVAPKLLYAASTRIPSGISAGFSPRVPVTLYPVLTM